jgi:hypothetical protein
LVAYENPQAGLHGVIKAIDGDIILMETGEGKTEIEVARWSVLGIDRGRASPPGKGA